MCALKKMEFTIRRRKLSNDQIQFFAIVKFDLFLDAGLIQWLSMLYIPNTCQIIKKYKNTNI